MKPRSGLAFALAILGGLAFASPIRAADSSTAPPTLREQLQQHITRPEFASALWGIQVATADAGQEIFASQARTLLKPASTAKLFTAALVLDLFGLNHRIRTDLIPRGEIRRDGTLQGDLIVFGRGDFSFASRFNTDSGRGPLDTLADALSRAGIRRIDGSLVPDDSFFAGRSFGNGWTWDDLRYNYGAAVSALTAEDNVAPIVIHPGAKPGDPPRIVAGPGTEGIRIRSGTLTTGPERSRRSILVQGIPGSPEFVVEGNLPVGTEAWRENIPVADPAIAFAGRLRDALEAHGIPVTHGVSQVRGADREAGSNASTPPRPAISVESRPLSEMVRQTMKPSQNLYAQLLLLQAGTTVPAQDAGETPEARGLRALAAFLGRAGIPAREVLLDDGSGLSRSSLVTPHAIVELLRFMDRHPHRETFLDALPIAGIDGNLRTRFTDAESLARGNLRAKTGTLRHVNALSGYVTNAAGHRLVMAVMLNAYEAPEGGISGRNAVDAAAELIARSRE